jgi:predicted NAD-dependent protein-ADP-ribosyltransferase YbiA (DUF1768 family)
VKTLGLLAFLLLAGCSVLQPGAAVDEAIGEALAAARTPAAEQKAALARAQEAFTGETSVVNRLRLATLLAALPAPLRDDARALELLGPIADPASAGAGRFAALLSGQIMERQRLGREVERLSRERAAAEKEHAAADKERDKREEALRQQLEALRTIERSILEREEKLRKRQR